MRDWVAAFLLWSELRRLGAQIGIEGGQVRVHPPELASQYGPVLNRYRSLLARLAGPWTQELALRLHRELERELGCRLRRGMLRWLFSERPEELEAIGEAGFVCGEALKAGDWDRFAEALRAYWEVFERAEAAYRSAR
jgi:hypothetical protein|nr:MAG: hypothetical protein KatS3mg041_0485 [Bacteroidota bacterium]